MKHHQPITRKPELAQTTTVLSNFQAFKDFLVTLVSQAIEFVFQMTMPH